MILSLFIFAIVLTIDLVTDVRIYFGRKKVNYVRGNIFRIIGLSPVYFILGWYSIPVMFFLYLTLFNGIYNKLLGLSWEYLGTTSFLDRLQYKYKYSIYIKYGGLLISLILFLWLYLKKG